ncbi:hypothetical protein [Luteolibacter sp. LG18]|uniref:hypothetical protein n=1 Tax=Luteolibacter sp. LG18 TaxID=2819286 RepID=UPI0030C73D93
MILRFLTSLHETGRAELAFPGRVPVEMIRLAGSDPEERKAIHRLLHGWYEEAVRDLPGPPLAYHAAGAEWGAIRLVRAACFLGYRDIEAEEIPKGLPGTPLPDAELPEAHFSADLALRHFADLFRMARALSEDDPLLAAMQALAVMAPLAAAGVPVTLPEDSPVFRHAGLCQLLAERAYGRKDRALLAHPRIAPLVRTKLGAYVTELGSGLLSPVVVES